MDALRFRTRSTPQAFGGRELCGYDPSLLDRNHECTVITGQQTWDRKNYWPNGFESMIDIGSDFTSKKYEYEAGSTFVDWVVPHWLDFRYKGHLLPEGINAAYGLADHAGYWTGDGGLTPSGEMNLVSLGATAISRCAPTNPHADMAVTLGELYRDGLPAVTGLTTLRGGGRPSAVAGEYLNHQFGVKPLISDLKKLARAVSESDKILSQYYRDSGRVVRRRYSFPSQTESKTWRHLTNVSCWPVLDYHFWSQPYGNVDVTVISEKRTWFSGGFSYYAKPVSAGPIARAAQQANHLLGLGITPSTVYDLTPWSWAVDWFTNLGDVINNVSMMQSDGLVLRWGYIMEEYSNTVTRTWSGGTAFNGSRPTLSSTFKYTYKRRRKATPFGFGLTNADLTPRQWAIIAALGLSRGGEYHALSR